MKKIIFTLIAMFSVISATNITVSADKYKSIERVLNPVASVYTHWDDEEQTNQKYNYNYVLISSSSLFSYVLPTDDYWQKPTRALYYKFDLSSYIEQGYILEEAVVVQNGPDSRIVRFIDCPTNSLENGQNYKTVPAHEKKSFKDFDCATANIGFEAVNEMCSDLNDANCVFDITDYVQSKLNSGKTSFTYMMYPYYAKTTIYFMNHARLYVKMKKAYDNVLFINCNGANMLNISGDTGATEVNIIVTDSNGNICFDETKSLSEDECYYHTVFNMNGLSRGEYTVTGTFDGETVVKKFNYIPKDSTDGSIYTSVDYSTGIARIYGTMNQENDDSVMITVLNPGYTEWDYSDTDAVNYIEVSETDKGHYDFSFKLNGEEGDYTVIVQGLYGTVETFFTYYPESQLGIDNGIDKYTSTYYAPWLLNWHMTKSEQIDAGYYGGEAGQMCWSMAISPTNPDIVLVGTDTNCIWKSTDGGKSWRNTSAGFEIMGTADIAFDPENENIVYVLGATGTKNPQSQYGGIYKSNDCGETWERVFDNYYYRLKNNKIIAFGQRNEDGIRRIFAGGHGVGVGSVYSEDEGKTWEVIKDIPVEAVISDVVIKDDVLLFASNIGLFVSYDNGETFDDVSPVFGTSYTATIDTTDSTHWICGADKTIYETLDSGATWEAINTTDKGIASVCYGIGDDPILYLYLHLEHYPLRYSTDDGRTFITPSKATSSTEFIEDNTGWGDEPFALHPTDENIILVSFDGEIYKSTDGGKTYFASSSGYSGMRATDFLFDENDENNIFLSFIDRGVVKTVNSDKGEKYPMVNYDASEDSTGIRYGGSKTTLAMARDPKDPDRIIINIGGNGYTLKQSYDGGDTYTIISSAGEITTKCIEFNKDNTYTIYAGKKISYDNGLTWNESEVAVEAVCPFNGNTVYGIKDGRMAKSDDEGRTWETISESIGSVSSITPDLFEEGAVYVAGYSKIVHIFSDGTTEVISPSTTEFENAEQFVCLTVAQNPRNPKHLLAGGTDNSEYGKSGGIYESLDGGNHWRVVSGMPGSRDIWKIEFHPLLPRAYIATSAGTFVYEYEKYYGENIVVTDSDFEVASGKLDDGRYKVDCSMTIWNTTEALYDAMVVYAVYDSDTKKLIRAYKQDIRLNPTNNVTVNNSISIGENDFVKIFIWNDAYNPLLEKYGWQILKNIKK